MLPRKIFKNLRTAVAILYSTFEQFLGKFGLKFFAPKSECFIEYDAFCLCIFDYACLGRKALLLWRRLKIIENLYSSKTCLKKAGGGAMHPPLDLALPALITISL